MKSRQFSLKHLFFNNHNANNNNANNNANNNINVTAITNSNDLAQKKLEKLPVDIPQASQARGPDMYRRLRVDIPQVAHVSPRMVSLLQISTSPIPATPPSPCSPGRAPLSILKKRIASSGEAVELTLGSCSSIGSIESTPPCSAPNSPTLPKRKSAQFRDNVDVMYFSKDDSANNTSRGKREQEKLKEVSSKKSRQTSANHLILCPLHNHHCNEELLSFFTDVQGNIITSEQLLPGKRFEIITNDDGTMKWKITVPLGNEFIRNRTNVKAMTGGKKLIVTGFKQAKTEEGEEYFHQYNDKLSLPHTIDAYAVKATMDREGNLKITAPIVSFSAPSTPQSLSNAVV